MLEPLLQAAGLDPKEAQVYEQILRNGQESPATLLKTIPIKRGDLYNVLRRLDEKKLIYTLPKTKKLTYGALAPDTIEQSIKSQERVIKDVKEQISLLYSFYNLGVGKPGVRFAQGIEGIKEIFNDTLNAKTEIVGYADIDGWLTHLETYAVWYARERRRRKIRERVIIPDTPRAKEYITSYNKSMTEIKFVPHQKFQFSLELNVYDNKVAYVTFREPFISILIEDQAIADTQRAIFELNWKN